MKIDRDIQEQVADEFCNKLDKGELHLFNATGWALDEMRKRQAKRDREALKNGG
jgi:hypothetical protein